MLDVYKIASYSDKKNIGIWVGNKNNLEKIYYTSLCYEFMFWQMSWDMDSGPKILQI